MFYKHFTTLFCSLIVLMGAAQFVGVTHEVFYTDDGTIENYPVGHTTYRLYAEYSSGNDQCSAVFALTTESEASGLTLGASNGSIWNSPLGAVTGDAINPAFFAVFPAMEYDSYITIGRSNSGDGLDGWVTYATGDNGDPFVTAFTDENASNLVLEDGVWFSTTDQPNTYAQGADYRVLLAQITTDGDITYQINVQSFTNAENEALHFWDANVASSEGGMFCPTCAYPPVISNCTDAGACNYNAEAAPSENEFCAYEGDPCDDGDALTVGDVYTTGCGCVGEAVVSGCLDPAACNYDPAANFDSGFCILPGCDDPIACNYDDTVCGGGECLFITGCSEAGACNYNALAQCEAECVYPGCTDDAACNYDPAAGCDDGTCAYDPEDCFGVGGDAQIYHEVFYQDDGSVDGYPAGHTTYRIYAQLDSPNDCLVSCFAQSGQDLFLGTSTDNIWNSQFGAEVGDAINPAFIQAFPSVEYDSFVTIGRHPVLPEDGLTGTITAVSQLPSNTVFTDIFGTVTSNQDLIIQDGVWFTTPGQSAGYGQGGNNRVLLAQITTDGDLEYNLNLQQLIGGVGGLEARAIWNGDQIQDPSVEAFCPTCSYPLGGWGCANTAGCNYDPEADGSDYFCDFPGDPCNDGDPDTVNDTFAGDCNCEGEPVVMGCTNYNACNYNELANVDDNSCALPGCNDANACNYDPTVGCFNPSDCDYPNTVYVQVFQDSNGNGSWEAEAFNEPALGTLGSIYVPEAGITLYPDDFGRVETPPLEPGTYTFEFTDGDGNWSQTTAAPTVVLPNCAQGDVEIGIDSNGESFTTASGPCCIFLQDIHCVLGFNPGLWILNSGTTPINGQFIMTFDANLTPEYHPSSIPYDSASPGELIWNFSDQEPGDNALYQCHIQGPGPDLFGEIIPIHMQLVLFDSQGDVFSTETWTLYPEVVCAYDPNDKYAIPEGYAGPNFIGQEQELEYRIRFQNTGNAVAVNVRIEDQLDVENLDLNTFEPLFGSHDFTACVEESGLVNFHFDNIFLPDSTEDEPGSQGYIVYRIRPKLDLTHGTEITNEANIYFDFNEPVLTNQTLHTIMDCEGLSQFDLASNAWCAWEEIQLNTGNPDYVDSYDWMLTGETFSNEPNPSLTVDEPGAYLISQWISNPICSVMGSQEVTVNALPAAEVVPGAIPCAGDVFTVEVNTDDQFQWEGFAANEPLEISLDEATTLNLTLTHADGCATTTAIQAEVLPLPDASFSENGTTLSANEGTAWQWYLDGQPIEGATGQTYEVETTGEYAVEVTNADGCSDLGDAVLVTHVSVNELEVSTVVFPNPAEEMVQVQFSQSLQGTLRLVSLTGQTIVEQPFAGASAVLDIASIASGNYLLHVETVHGEVAALPVRKR